MDKRWIQVITMEIRLHFDSTTFMKYVQKVSSTLTLKVQLCKSENPAGTLVLFIVVS